ncbi:MAG: rod shape-determining protein RodA [Elusimicrobia bacterium]|nr:rod shape-determining protein RodA [Elusimicrobiota bacterium]
MRKKIDTIILACVLLLGAWSVVMVISTTLNTSAYSNLYIKQLVAFVAGFFLLLFFRKFSYKILEELSPLIYMLSVILLVAVLVIGTEIHGGRRWLSLGFFYFQPVEFAKISVVLLLARILKRRGNVFLGAVAVGAVVLLVLVQPDAGSALIFIPVFVLMLAVSHVNTNWMLFFIPFVMLTSGTLFLESYLNVKSLTLLSYKFALIPVLMTIFIYITFREIKKIKRYLKYGYLVGVILLLWISLSSGIGGAKCLRTYQKKRIVSFMVPELDPLGAGYNTRQSLLAVGSGRILGKGLFHGTQTQLGFLPVKHNDFIFASVSEEMGFIGAVIMMIIITVLLWQIINVMERSEDYGSRLISCGVFAILFSQAILNIGVVLGLLPVIGIQLPLVSYGGTGMVSVMVMVGIILNINRRTEIIGR